MSTPLVDIDANPRQSGFRIIKDGSKIPSPPKFQRSGVTCHHSPFAVSTTGSPYHTVMPTATKTALSLTPTSRLPRKSTPASTPMPTLRAFSKSYAYGTKPATPRSSLPWSRGGLKQSAIAVPHSSDLENSASPLSCNKPLPSPPIAQLVNQQSPPKAQRTLVDAEAGSPTEGEWPIIRPNNIFLSATNVLSSSDGWPQRSTSEGSALRPNGIPMLRSQLIRPSSAENHTPSQKSYPFILDENSSHRKFRQMTPPRTFSSMNPYAESFHAFSTNTEIAIDSPLTYKQRTPPVVCIPPRISSKRSSVLLSDKICDEAPTQPLSDSSRSIKPGSTIWPVLETTAGLDPIQKVITEELKDHEHHRFGEAAQGGLAFPGPTPTPESYTNSIDNMSLWSLAAGSSLRENTKVDFEGSVRIKRLSRHSSNPNSGPTLRISGEADAVLLGRDDFVPAVPTLPKQSKSLESSFSTLARHVSKQVLVKMTPRTSLRSLTPSSGKTERNENKPANITPISSMHSSRKPGIEELSKGSTSSIGLMLVEIGQAEQVGGSSSDESRGSFMTSQETPWSQTKAKFKDQASNEAPKKSYEDGNYSTTLEIGIPQRSMQVLGTEGDNPMAAVRERLPMTWVTLKSANSTAMKADTKRMKTSTSLLSAEYFNNRASASSTRPPSPTSTNIVQSKPLHNGAHRPGPSTLGATVNSPHASNCSGEAQHTEHDAIDAALKIKSKRSLRNIFQRRDPKPKKQDSKRSSVVGGALAQRIWNSTNISKVNLARPYDTNTEVEKNSATALNNGTIGIESNRQVTLAALDPGLPDISSKPTPAAQYDTATVVHKLLDRVTSIEANSPDRLRGLEIAEAVLHAIECSKEAKLSAELAWKHAHDAELNAKRAGVELKQLEKLCEPGFDYETLQAMKQLITAVVNTELSEPAEK